MIKIIIQKENTCSYDAETLKVGSTAVYYQGARFCNRTCFQAWLRQNMNRVIKFEEAMK